MLEAKIKSYEATGTTCRSNPTDFYAEFPFLKEVDAQALTSEKINLHAAFKNFFERKADGVGFPQFKAKHRDKESYTSYTTNHNIRVEGRKLRLPKVGFVSFRNYEDIDWSARDIKHVTVSRSRAGNYYASILRIAREHEKVANRRKDFLDKLSTRLLRENQTVAVEDLDVREVAEGDHAKSEHDPAWRMFLNKLQYKAEWYGRTIVRVGRWFPSSQLCHCCGFKNTLTKDLNVRSWTCPQCGTSHDRDVNAAINILTEGKRIIAAGTAVKGAGNNDTQREAHSL